MRVNRLSPMRNLQPMSESTTQEIIVLDKSEHIPGLDPQRFRAKSGKKIPGKKMERSWSKISGGTESDSELHGLVPGVNREGAKLTLTGLRMCFMNEIISE